MTAKKTTHLHQQAALFKEQQTPREAFRCIRNYLAGQFVGATRDDTLLDEVLKCLFCKLTAEREEQAFETDTVGLAKQVRAIFAKVRRQFPEIYPPDEELLLDPEAIRFIMEQLPFSIADAVTDSVGDAFEIFVGSESKGNSGQFFTPRNVTTLLVEALKPQPHETVLDPACGAGGFLTATCGYFLRQGIAPEEISSWTEQRCFGVDKDDYLAKLAKVHLSLLTGAHPAVVCGDSLAMRNGDKSLEEYLPQSGVDVLLTNPPFGVKIVAAKPEVLGTFSLARRWVKDPRNGSLAPSNTLLKNVPPQVLFVERALSLVRPGGRLGLVVPESLLSNKSYRHVVEYLMRHADVQAVMGMPEALFKTSGKGGTHTKTCLLIAVKLTDKRAGSKQIFMAEAKWCGQDSRARTIPYNDLPEIAQRFKAFQAGKPANASTLGFAFEKSALTKNILCPRYYDPQADRELDALSKTHQLLRFGDLVKNGVLSLATGDEVGKLAYGTGDIPFIRTSDISNWEIKADPKHGLSLEWYEKLRAKQDMRAGDIVLVKDGTYLIGTCTLIGEGDAKIVYQSHLYKIRVHTNAFGLNPYLLLAVLSSSLVQKQIRAKQFTLVHESGSFRTPPLVPMRRMGTRNQDRGVGYFRFRVLGVCLAYKAP
ncbi:MAG: N-6 DNA methylase [Gammaproteobacteria bacterium]|nr:N-6 DNA methylase [Gammaproteobacteria bacterium]